MVNLWHVHSTTTKNNTTLSKVNENLEHSVCPTPRILTEYLLSSKSCSKWTQLSWASYPGGTEHSPMGPRSQTVPLGPVSPGRPVCPGGQRPLPCALSSGSGPCGQRGAPGLSPLTRRAPSGGAAYGAHRATCAGAPRILGVLVLASVPEEELEEHFPAQNLRWAQIPPPTPRSASARPCRSACTSCPAAACSRGPVATRV